MQGDFVTSDKLSDDGGLPSRIPVGMRVAPVSVNDVVSVAGFAKPDTFVDVLITGHAPDSSRLQTITVLQNVRVLAAGTQPRTWHGKRCPRIPRCAVVTLLVSPEDAEKLTLAAQEGRIRLIIRNPSDGSLEKTPPVRDLYDATPRKKPFRVRYLTPLPPPDYEIQLFRGGQSERVKVKE